VQKNADPPSPVEGAADSAAGPVSLERERPGANVPGEILCGRYQLVRPLRAGGMGTVWLARHLVLDMDVAIKLLLPRLLTPEFAARLVREARATAQIDHPNIVRVLDVGETGRGEPFLAMEYLRGSSLADVIDLRGRFAARTVVQLALPLVDALATAHAKSIIHRDLKPDNVIMTVSDSGIVVPKIVDFGIAKVAEDDGERRLTQTGAVLGSPDYMAPEQARGELDVDQRTDVWAMCVMLYELLTGVRPFNGPNYNALLHAILSDDPVPTTEFFAGDDALWKIVSLGLEKRTSRRLPDMSTLGRMLAEWAIAEGITEDVMGTSLDAVWLRASRHSGIPPSATRSSKPPSRGRTTQITPSGSGDISRPRSEASTSFEGLRSLKWQPWMIAPILAALLVVGLTLSLRERRASDAPPPPAIKTERPPSPATAPTVTLSAPLPAAPPPATSAAPSATVTASAHKPPSPARSAAPRALTGSLPIPAVPNF
jgi:eukaryotic-like serine/threonine-protein kinase